MRTLILAIETAGEEWESLDPVAQTELTDWIDRSARSETERVAAHADVVRDLHLSPLTGRIAALAVRDRERAEATAYYADDGSSTDTVEGKIRSKGRDEVALLREFWDGAQHYDAFVTFTGRAVALPFLLHRSVACGVRPTVDLLRSRYLTRQQPPYHIDLADELSFYGILPRKPSLHLLCRAYSIESPRGRPRGG